VSCHLSAGADRESFALTVDGIVIVDGTLASGSGPAISRIDSEEPCTDVFLGYPHGPKTSEFVPVGAVRRTSTFRLGSNFNEPHTAEVHASRESFLCEDRPSAAFGSQMGRAESRRFNAVYDRSADRLTTFDAIELSLRYDRRRIVVRWKGTLTVRVKPEYVKRHLGYFLWDNHKPLWNKPVAGWCSWMAHLRQVRERDVLDAARFFGSNLKEFGYDVIQIDDGYQRAMQSGEPPLKTGERISELWTIPNDKFPRGLAPLAKDIEAQGLTPGIWVGLFLPLGIQNAAGYVTGDDGKPLRGPWVNYAVNGLDKSALFEAYLETIRVLRKQGWSYFKIDTLRHVLYDNYRKVPNYWKRRNESPEQAFRRVLEGIKREAGPNTYTLACWGSLPELAGIVDGCRIGEDVGPDFNSMRRSAKYIAQFHHLNNVVWLNDPDYMCLRLPAKQAETWITLTALAGGHLMVSDPVKEYDAERLSMLRKAGPPMLLRPSVVVPLAADPEFQCADIEKDGQRWTLIARYAWKPEAAVDATLTQFGLDENASYLAFDFWRSTPERAVDGKVHFRELKQGECQLLALRRLEDHPQVLGTDRHLGQGAVELERVRWKSNQLSGTMKLGRGQRWSLWIHVPDGWVLNSFEPSSATLLHDGADTKVTFSEASGSLDWMATFDKRRG
jgi:alpha-galactosidase